jgi:hypothetical protein
VTIELSHHRLAAFRWKLESHQGRIGTERSHGSKRVPAAD